MKKNPHTLIQSSNVFTLCLIFIKQLAHSVHFAKQDLLSVIHTFTDISITYDKMGCTHYQLNKTQSCLHRKKKERKKSRYDKVIFKSEKAKIIPAPSPQKQQQQQHDNNTKPKQGHQKLVPKKQTKCKQQEHKKTNDNENGRVKWGPLMMKWLSTLSLPKGPKNNKK